MENLPPTAATNEPADPATSTIALPAVRVSDRLADSLVDPALDAGRDVRPGRSTRTDGWTPERIRLFLDALAECGVAEDAARAVGMSGRSARKLRNRTTNRAFHVAWTAAEQLARRRLSADLMSRAIHGCVEVMVRDGQIWGERHRYDNRLTMAVLTRLDRLALENDEESSAARIVAQEFDQFLDIVCAGGDGAAEFLAARRKEDFPGRRREAKILTRADNYRRYGVGLADEIDTSDLDKEEQATWTEEQAERARRAGLLGEPETEVAADEKGKAVPRALTWLPPDYGAAGRARTDEASPVPDEQSDEPPAQAAEDPVPADDYDEPSVEPVAATETPATVEESAPAPAKPAPTKRATCSPADYDPACGLAPPFGWVAPG